MKRCTKCKLEKPQNEFFKDKQKKTGYRPDCKVCNTNAYKKYAKKNRIKCNNANMKYRTGIDIDKYNILLKKQNNKCKICNLTEKENKKRFSIDHCHTSGFIRGLLCNKCNQGLGYFKDNIELLTNAIIYLNNNLEKEKIKYGK